MPKIYTKKSLKNNDLQPKKTTIKFILNYSKAIHIMKLKTMQVEVLQN